MSKNVYRLCLVMLILAAVLSGVLYYHFGYKQEYVPERGTFVWQNFEDETEVDV